MLVCYRGRPTPAAELTKAKPSDRSKHSSSKDKKPAASSSTGGSSSNLKEDGSQLDDQKVDTVRSRPKAADKDGRRDHKVGHSYKHMYGTNNSPSYRIHRLYL